MNKKLALLATMTLAVALLGGCANNGYWNTGDTGAVLGGVVGGVAGHQIGGGSGKTIATVVGAIAGSILGRRLGQRMTGHDRRQFGDALAYNPTGQSNNWTNNATNNSYSVTPTSSTYDSGNRVCRKFRMKATVNGQPDHVTGTACRQPDGSWAVQ